MSNDIIPWDHQERMAQAIAKSGLYGFKSPDQVLALMAVASAEGRHPGSVARDYHFIQGRPALKADAMLARFQQAGGRVEWLVYTDEKVEATFSHPQGGSLTLAWTLAQAKSIGLATKDNWKLYPRAMLRARVISEGIRTVYPGVLVGEYTPEEVGDFKEVYEAPAKMLPQIEITDEIEEEGIPFYTAPTGTVELYKVCKNADEWLDLYADMQDRIGSAKGKNDEWKAEKLKLLTEVNRDIINTINKKDQANG